MAARKTLLGLPIRGEVHRGDSVKQKPWKEFTDALQAVLDIDGFVALQWHQYTPYFNDGDPCTFNVYADYDLFKFEDTPEDSGEMEQGFVDADAFRPAGLYGYQDGIVDGPRRWEWIQHDPDEKPSERYITTSRFQKVITSGEHDLKLLELFGDHAEIRITRDGIDVDSYSHD